jgi:hypothetical protein
VRLVDAVLRQGHLSERALVEAIMTGDRPVHLDRCEICAERAVEIGHWLDHARTASVEAADEAFPAERLTAQHAQIMRKLEQMDQPSRVIHFPSFSRAEGRAQTDHRVAPAWVGVAAAAGLAIGLVGGQMTARMGDRQVPVPTVASNPSPDALLPIGLDQAEPGGTIDHSILDLDLDTLDVGPLDILNQATPSMIRASADRGGD